MEKCGGERGIRFLGNGAKGFRGKGIRKRSKRREGEIRGDNRKKRRRMFVQEDRRLKREIVRSDGGIKRRKQMIEEERRREERRKWNQEGEMND